MKKILLSKLKNLCCGDDGAALVITLGIFFFMYIFCAGVYAIGFAVKEKIQLQNACDAAAYSAAVVQADTISRIATLNRAMGWTYAQMCRRQMDYIVYRWLEHTVRHYEDDRIEASNWRLNSLRHNHNQILNGGHPMLHGEYSISNIDLNDHVGLGDFKQRTNLTPGNLDFRRLGLGDWISDHCKESMYKTRQYNIQGLEEQIYADKQTILSMNNEFDAYLDGLPTHVEDAVSAILKANIPTYMKDDCRYVIKQEKDPNGTLDRRNALFERMRNTMADERTFVRWGNGGWEEDYQPYGIGSLDDGGNQKAWYVRTNRDHENKEGIQRSYNFGKAGALVARWTWWAWYCRGCRVFAIPTPVYHKHGCSHGGNDMRCRCPDILSTTHSSYTYADSEHLMQKYRYYYIGERAFPRKLRADYFGPRGTITVGLAKQNTNPFFSVFRSAMETGFYSAFRPYNDWTWCFSSAKAGYKLFERSEDVGQAYDGEPDGLSWETRHNGKARAFNGPRDYCIDWKPLRQMRSDYVMMLEPIYRRINRRRVRVDWKAYWVYLPTENTARIQHLLDRGWKLVMRDGKLWREDGQTFWRQSWNLTQSDWDAVLLPVRQGGSQAWEENANSHLAWMMSVRNREKLYSYEPVWRELDAERPFIAKLLADNRWKDLDGRVTYSGRFGDMFAGGGHDPDPNGDWGENFAQTSTGWEGWWDIPKTAAYHPANQRAKVQCKWNIGKPNQKLEWANIGKLMFH